MRPPGKVEKANDARGTVARLWGYLRRRRAALLITAALVVGSTALNVALPYLLGYAIDAYVIPGVRVQPREDCQNYVARTQQTIAANAL